MSRTNTSESSRPQPAKSQSKPSMATRSARQTPILAPRPPRHARARNFRNGPSGKRKQRRQTIDLAAEPLPQPMPNVPPFRGQSLAQDAFRQLARQQDAIARHKPAAFGQHPMRRNEIWSHQAVAVEKDAIVAGGSEDGAVANFGEPEAFVRMPHVHDAAADAAVPVINHRFGIRSRTVIGYDHLEVGIGLVRERAQHRIERIRPIVGGDDDGNEIGHACPASLDLTEPECKLAATFPRRQERVRPHLSSLERHRPAQNTGQSRHRLPAATL